MLFTKAAGSPLAFWGVRDSRPAAVNCWLMTVNRQLSFVLSHPLLGVG
ncbi:hypothetical protein [Nostoc sp. NZL]|nr:hypothetical protein [Nostoc sp. NZL]